MIYITYNYLHNRCIGIYIYNLLIYIYSLLTGIYIQLALK